MNTLRILKDTLVFRLEGIVMDSDFEKIRGDFVKQLYIDGGIVLNRNVDYIGKIKRGQNYIIKSKSECDLEIIKERLSRQIMEGDGIILLNNFEEIVFI